MKFAKGLVLVVFFSVVAGYAETDPVPKPLSRAEGESHIEPRALAPAPEITHEFRKAQLARVASTITSLDNLLSDIRLKKTAMLESMIDPLKSLRRELIKLRTRWTKEPWPTSVTSDFDRDIVRLDNSSLTAEYAKELAALLKAKYPDKNRIGTDVEIGTEALTIVELRQAAAKKVADLHKEDEWSVNATERLSDQTVFYQINNAQTKSTHAIKDHRLDLKYDLTKGAPRMETTGATNPEALVDELYFRGRMTTPTLATYGQTVRFSSDPSKENEVVISRSPTVAELNTPEEKEKLTSLIMQNRPQEFQNYLMLVYQRVNAR